MVAIVGGNSFGLNLGSLSSLGQRGQLGSATQGRSGERAYVNVATGNLVLQDQDARLIGLGPDTATLRTYNSHGSYDFDGNADGWQGAPTKAIEDLGGGTLRRHDLDGSACDYAWDAGRGLYVAKVAAGSAVDTVRKNADGTYLWTDGASGTRETYQAGSFGRITSIVDTSGNALSFSYTNGLLTKVTSSGGETVTYTYGGASGKNLLEVRTTGVSGQLLSQVTYTYDELNRLKTVAVALNPKGDAPAGTLALTTYTTTYTYDGTSARVAGVGQSDGTTLGFTYVLVNGTYRVATVTDGLGKVTSFAYDTVNGTTTVTDPMGVSTVLKYDGAGQLTQVRTGVTASNTAGLSVATYAYDALGNVRAITDGIGRTVTFTYDAAGNLTKQVDGAGNTVERTYDARNQVLTETAYAGAAQPLTTRYVYDAAGKSLLRFELTAEGRVTEHRYDAYGQRISTVEYRAATYAVGGLAATAVPTEAELAAWASVQDLSRTVRADLGYDFRGQLQTTTAWGSVDAAGNGVAGTGSLTRYVYDERGQLRQTVTPDEKGITDTWYDGLGRVLMTVARSVDADEIARAKPNENPASITTITSYDDANRQTKVTLATGLTVGEAILVTTSTYDAAGRLASVVQSTSTAPNLGTTTYHYDAGGRLLMTQDPTGRRTFLFWDAAGRKVGEIDAAGGVTEYRYDAGGQLTQSTRYATALAPETLAQLVDASGKPKGLSLDSPVDRYEYVTVWDEWQEESWLEQRVAGQMPLRPAATAQDARTWRYYDAAGRLSMEVDALGCVTRTEYDGASRVLSVTRYATAVDVAAIAAGASPVPFLVPSGDDRVTTYVHDRDGRLRATIDGEGYLTELVYDASGRAVKSTRYAAKVPGFTDAASIAAAVATARATGSLATLLPAADPVKDIAAFTYYDASGRKVAEIDGESYLTERFYDANGNLWKSIRYANKVSAMVAADAQPGTLRPAASSEDRVSESTRDALGRLWRQKNAEGTVTELAYDAEGNVVRSTVALNTEEARTLLKQYDAQGRLTAELSGNGAALITSTSTQAEIDAIWAQHAVKHTYDAAGRRKTTTDALGKRTVFYYDDAGRLRFTVNGAGEITETGYDALGRVTVTNRYTSRVANPAALVGGLLSTSGQLGSLTYYRSATQTTYGYTARGDLEKVTDPLGGTVTNAYTAFGEVSSTTQSIDATRSTTTRRSWDRRGFQTGELADLGGVNAASGFERDAFGRLTRVSDANGNVRVQAYDRLGRIVQTIDPLNRSRFTTWDAFDRVLTQVDALGKATRYLYDADTRKMVVITPSGIVVTTVRNRHGQTLSVTDGRQNVTEYRYDRDGHLLSESEQLDAATTVKTERSYDRAGNLEFTTDARGVQTRYTYDAANRVLTQTEDYGGLNLVTTYGYDARGYQTSVRDPRGNSTVVQFDANGNVSYRFRDAGDRVYVNRGYTYDKAGRVLSERDIAGVVTNHVYDGLGRRIETVVDPVTASNPAGLNLRTAWTYDDAGNVTSRTDGNGNVTRYAYDAASRLVYTVDALGNVQKNEYDDEGRVTATIRYAAPLRDLESLPGEPRVADVASRIDSSPSDLAEYRVYDADGRVRTIVDGTGGVTRFTYDANGNVSEKVAYANRIYMPNWDRTTAGVPISNAADARTRTVYDALNRATYTIDGVGGVVSYAYDANGNVVERVAYFNKIPTTTLATKDAVSAALALVKDAARDVRTRTVYDKANRARFTVDGTGAVVEYVYDANGNVVKRSAFASRLTASQLATLTHATTVDELGAMVARDALADATVRNEYNLANWLVWTADGTGAVTRLFYDASGSVVKKVQYAARIASGAMPSSVVAGAGDRVTVLAYDKANRLAWEVDALGGVTQRVYDGAGNVVQRIAYANRTAVPTATTDPATVGASLATWATGAGASAENRVTRSVYDAAGRLTYAIDAAGAVTRSQYDGAGNVVAVQQFGTALTAAQLGTLGASATAASVAGLVTANAVVDRTTLRAYDAGGYLVYEVDPLGYVEKSAYDGAGRLTATTLYGEQVSGLSIGASVSSIDAALSIVNVAGNDRTDAFRYDAAGNVVGTTDALGKTESHGYSGTGAKVSFTNKLNATWTYAYDTAGRLVEETSPLVSVTTRVVNASGEVDVPATDRQLRTVLAYDAFGNLTKRTEAAGLAEERTTRYAYDLAGRQVKTTYPKVKVYAEDPASLATNGATSLAARVETELEPTVEVVYDAFGQAVSNKDVSGSVSYKTYDALGRVQYEVDALGYVTERVRNAFGEETRLVRWAERPALTSATAATPPSGVEVASALALLATGANRAIDTVRDALGRATTVTMPVGYVRNYWRGIQGSYAETTKHEYDAFGQEVRRLALVNPASGTWATVATRQYDRRGQETATVDALGYVTYREYDAAGNLTKVTERVYALPGTTVAGVTTFNLAAVPAGSIDDRVVTYGYDLANRRTSETRLSVECTEPNEPESAWYAWDAEWSTITGITDPAVARRNLTTLYAYDAVGNLTRTTDALGGVTVTQYDALGRISAVTAPARTSTVDGSRLVPLTVFRRDAHGNVVERIEYAKGESATAPFTPAAPGDPGDRITRMRYDVAGRALETVDAEGVAHLMSYDAAGRVAKEWQGVNSAASGAALATTLFTAYRYDAMGRQVAVVTPGSTSVLSGGYLTTVGHDVAGTVTTSVRYNAFGEVVERYTAKTGAAPAAADVEFFEYDNAGHLWRTNERDGQVKIRTYDLLGFQTAEITSDGVVDLRTVANAQLAEQNPALRKTRLYRDDLGRVRYQYLPTRTDTTFDAYGTRLDTTVSPYVYMTYDRWGNVLSQTDARSSSWVTYYRYDANDNVIDRWEPSEGGTAKAGPCTLVRYDALGRQVAVRDARGYVNRQVWDAAGQLVKEVHADTGVVTYSYDAFGNRVRTVDAMGKGTQYGYDKMGRNTTVTSDVVEVWTANSVSSVAKVGDLALTTTKIYDWAGRLVRQINGDNEATTYTLDRRGQVIATALPLGQTTVSAFDVNGRQIAERDPSYATATWTYDAFGLLVGKKDIGNATYTFGYDQARQLKTQTNTRGQNLAFTYDAAGQLVRIVDNALGKTTDYGYSRAGHRVWERTIQGGTVYQSQRLMYDALGRLQKVETWDGIVIEFDYDPNGNRTFQRTTYNTIRDATPRVKQYFFAYDAMNRQTLVDGAVNNDAGDAANIVEGQGHIIRYDKNGNRVADAFWGTRVVARQRWVTVREDTVPVTYYRELVTTYELYTGRMKEFYRYDNLNRLIAVKMGSLTDGSGGAYEEVTAPELDARLYDAASRIVHVGPQYPSPYGYTGELANTPYTDSNGARQRISRYDDNGRLLSQHVRKSDGTFESETNYRFRGVVGYEEEDYYNYADRAWDTRFIPIYGTVSGYDSAGNVTGYTVRGADNVTRKYTRTLGRWDGYRETRIDAEGGGTTTSGYDANGFLTTVDDWNLWQNDRTLVNDANGVVLQKTQGGAYEGLLFRPYVLRQLVVDGNAMGTYGIGQDPNDPTHDDGTPNFTTQANFDLTYQPIVNTAAGTGHYSVRPGDTLRSIALATYGDPELWYLVADANGLRSDADLRVGQELAVPTRPAGTHNKAGIFKPYDPSKVIGDTSPHIPQPEPEDDGCAVVKLIVVVVVVVAVTIATSGALAALAPALSGFAGGMVAGAIAGAVGSLAGQGMAIAMGMQDGIDWTQVGLSALGGAVSAGVGEALSGVAKGAKEITGAWGTLARSGVAAARAALTSAATQGIAIVAGLEEDFSWRDVAAAAASGAASGAMSKATDGFKGTRVEKVVLETATGTMSSTVAAIARGGRIDMASIAADAFGNALGNAVGEAISEDIAERVARRADRNALRLRLSGVPLPSSGLPGDLTLSSSMGFDYSGEVEDPIIEEATAGPESEAPPPQEPAPAGEYRSPKPGQGISSLIGTSDPQAIGAFMRANGLTSTTIHPDQQYFVPADPMAYGDASALGQDALDTDNAAAAERAQRASQERLARDAAAAQGTAVSSASPFGGVPARSDAWLPGGAQESSEVSAFRRFIEGHGGHVGSDDYVSPVGGAPEILLRGTKAEWAKPADDLVHKRAGVDVSWQESFGDFELPFDPSIPEFMVLRGGVGTRGEVSWSKGTPGLKIAADLTAALELQWFSHDFDLGVATLTPGLRSVASAHAGAEAVFKPDQIEIKGEVGAEAVLYQGSAVLETEALDLGFANLSLRAEGKANVIGIGAKAHADLGFSDGRLRSSAGAALTALFGLEGSLTVDFDLTPTIDAVKPIFKRDPGLPARRQDDDYYYLYP